MKRKEKKRKEKFLLPSEVYLYKHPSIVRL